MTGERILVSDHFEILIAQARLSKAELAAAAGVSRVALFRALQTKPNADRTALRSTTAWKLARAYAEHTNLDLGSAFARLFVRVDEPEHEDLTQTTVDMMPTAGLASPDVRSTALKKPANLRLDDETLRMLDALMQDEDRSSQRDMIRALIRRAYRALVARRAAAEGPLRDTPNSDKPNSDDK